MKYRSFPSLEVYENRTGHTGQFTGSNDINPDWLGEGTQPLFSSTHELKVCVREYRDLNVKHTFTNFEEALHYAFPFPGDTPLEVNCLLNVTEASIESLNLRPLLTALTKNYECIGNNYCPIYRNPASGLIWGERMGWNADGTRAFSQTDTSIIKDWSSLDTDGNVSLINVPCVNAKGVFYNLYFYKGPGYCFLTERSSPETSSFMQRALSYTPPAGDHCELSTTGGGNGTCSFPNDPLPVPEHPGYASPFAVGMVDIFVPAAAEMVKFARYLWNSDLSSTLKKMVLQPMDVVEGMMVMPTGIQNPGVEPPPWKSTDLIIGNVATGLKMLAPPSQFRVMDMGTLAIEPYWDNFLDYAPHTKIEIFLPFVGMRSLDPADVMGKTISLQYVVDYLTGTCMAQISVDGQLKYEFGGNVATQIPLTSRDWNNAISNAIGQAADFIGGSGMSVRTGEPNLAFQAATIGAAQTIGSPVRQPFHHAGGTGGPAGSMGSRYPYIRRELPRQSLPSGYGKLYGWPSNITSKLADLSGFTMVDKIHLDGIPATSTERDEIETLLKGGVIL